jgi:hypothetical protein
MTAKIPTPQSISALLKRAGYERSESSTTRIKGWRSYSYGYIVKGRGPGEVRVYHVSGMFAPTDEALAENRKMEARYAETIEAAGYTVARTLSGNPTVLVTAKAD